MYKIYLKQAWALLKENKLLSGVSIFGTALANYINGSQIHMLSCHCKN